MTKSTKHTDAITESKENNFEDSSDGESVSKNHNFNLQETHKQITNIFEIDDQKFEVSEVLPDMDVISKSGCTKQAQVIDSSKSEHSDVQSEDDDFEIDKEEVLKITGFDESL